MKHQGFMITRLALTGPKVEDAELQFRRGLNVITGPSDTGKTFAFQCIDFMLGAGKAPKSIPEARGYDSVSLDIRDYETNRDISLTRSLSGGQFKLNDEGKERVLKEKHVANDDKSASQYYLNLSDLQAKRIRKNENGETVSFSFRKMAHLSVISEEDVIKNISPILSGQRSTATEEKSAFNLLISGSDDSSIVAIPDPKEVKKRFEAKEEVLGELIAKQKLKIQELQVDADLPDLIEQLDRLEQLINECTESLNEMEESTALLEEIRSEAWARLKPVESRIDFLFELQARFSLLNDQYHSDMLRLQAIEESSIRLDEMSLEHCPVCGALSKNQDPNYQEYQTDPLSVAESCASEVSKIKGLISDLELTRGDIKREINELNSKKSHYQDELKIASLNLQDHLNTRINHAINNLNTHQERKEHILKAISQYEQLRELEKLQNDLQKESSEKREKPKFTLPDNHYLEEFAKAVQERLKAWKFPYLDRVTFDGNAYDIVISGRPRSSHGKGVRAVTHAAFTLSLLRYCLDNDLPHSGVVVIDSPLVVYRQPDADEESFSSDVKLAFYYDLSQSFLDSQVIIIENDAPPDDLVSTNSANIIQFTGTSQGRYGFIPTQRQFDKVA